MRLDASSRRGDARRIAATLEPAGCTRCGSPLTGELVDAAALLPGLAGTPFAGRGVRECAACGWLNCDGALTTTVDLGRVEDLTGRPLPDDGGLAILAAARSRLVQGAAAEVRRAPLEAVAWLMAVLAEDRSRRLDARALWAQHVYLQCVLAHGPLPALVELPEHLTGWWGGPAGEALELLRQVAGLLREADARLRVDVHNRTAVAEASSTWAWEVNVNRLRQDDADALGRMVEAVVHPLVERAERLAFGGSLAARLDVLGDDGLEERTRVMRDVTGRVRIIDLGPRCDPDVRRAAASLTLTIDRLRRSRVPAFFPSSQPHRDVPPRQVLEESAGIDWLHYAPLLSASYDEGDGPRPAVIAVSWLLTAAFQRAASSVAHRLHGAAEAARRDPVHGPEVAKAVRAFHAKLEQDVLDRLAAAGLAGRAGVERADGRPLPCGEIDVLAHGRGSSGASVVLVAEVKDTDVSFYKDHGPAQAQATVDRAADQALRKAAWVAAEWPAAARVLGVAPAPAPLVVALVITRVMAMPSQRPVGVVSGGEVGEAARRLLAEPPDAWRPDVRAGLVGPETVPG